MLWNLFIGSTLLIDQSGFINYAFLYFSALSYNLKPIYKVFLYDVEINLEILYLNKGTKGKEVTDNISFIYTYTIIQ